MLYILVHAYFHSILENNLWTFNLISKIAWFYFIKCLNEILEYENILEKQEPK